MHIAVITQQQNELKQWRNLNTPLSEIKTLISNKQIISTWKHEKTVLTSQISDLSQQMAILQKRSNFLEEQDRLQKESNKELENMVAVKQNQLNQLQGRIGTHESIENLLKVLRTKQEEINQLRIFRAKHETSSQREAKLEIKLRNLQNENVKIKNDLKNVIFQILI